MFDFVTEPPPVMNIPMTAPPTYEKIQGAVGGVEESCADHSGRYNNIYDDVCEEPPPFPPATDDRSSMSPASQKPKTKPKSKSTEKTRTSADHNDYIQPTSHLASVI